MFVDPVMEKKHGTPEFPVAVKQEAYPPRSEWLFYSHWHDELEFIQLLSGEAVLYINATPYTVRAGDFLLIPSAAIHYAKALCPQECKTRVLLCSPTFLTGCDEQDVTRTKYLRRLSPTTVSAALYHPATLPSAGHAADLIAEIIRLMNDRPAVYELLVRARLTELMYLAFAAALPETRPAVQEDVSAIRRSLHYLHTHYQQDIQLSDLAQTAHMSLSQYGRLFKRSTARTPIAYLVEYRVRRAAQLLAETNRRVSDIAMDVGFRNFSYFNRCFRQVMNVTPSQYRRQRKAPG